MGVTSRPTDSGIPPPSGRVRETRLDLENERKRVRFWIAIEDLDVRSCVCIFNVQDAASLEFLVRVFVYCWGERGAFFFSCGGGGCVHVVVFM